MTITHMTLSTETERKKKNATNEKRLERAGILVDIFIV